MNTVQIARYAFPLLLLMSLTAHALEVSEKGKIVALELKVAFNGKACAANRVIEDYRPRVRCDVREAVDPNYELIGSIDNMRNKNNSPVGFLVISSEPSNDSSVFDSDAEDEKNRPKFSNPNCSGHLYFEATGYDMFVDVNSEKVDASKANAIVSQCFDEMLAQATSRTQLHKTSVLTAIKKN